MEFRKVMVPHGGPPRVRNSVTVESPYGLRNFTLVLGDITQASDPVLVVPTHANIELPVSGDVLRAVEQRFAASFHGLDPLLVPEAGFGTFRVRDVGQFPGREILLVRIPGRYSVEASGDQPPTMYRQALWSLFGSLAALELRDNELKSLALPLLGATRGYAIRDLMRATLEHSLAWLKASRFMNAINFYLVDQPHIDEWAAAMDDVLGRKFVDSAQNELIRALRDEILAHLAAGQLGVPSPNLQVSIDGLRESLQQQRISLDRVAAAARRLVESIVDVLLKEQGIANPKGDLYHQINQLRDLNLTAPWIISHLQCLRVFGNEGVHRVSEEVSYRPARLRDEDLVAILASVQRVLAFAATRD